MTPGLTMHVPPCTDIAKAAADAQGLVDTTNRCVGFTFNSVRCVAWPGGSAERLVEAYNEAANSELIVYSDSIAVKVERRVQ